MVRWAVVFFVVALLSAQPVPSPAAEAGLAEILFGVFLIFFVVMLTLAVMPGRRGPRPPL
jgi:uncharacterized membrane protein YtjA (UPF0391 family)